jgi:hypothetical protein
VLLTKTRQNHQGAQPDLPPRSQLQPLVCGDSHRLAAQRAH